MRQSWKGIRSQRASDAQVRSQKAKVKGQNALRGTECLSSIRNLAASSQRRRRVTTSRKRRSCTLVAQSDAGLRCGVETGTGPRSACENLARICPRSGLESSVETFRGFALAMLTWSGLTRSAGIGRIRHELKSIDETMLASWFGRDRVLRRFRQVPLSAEPDRQHDCRTLGNADGPAGKGAVRPDSGLRVRGLGLKLDSGPRVDSDRVDEGYRLPLPGDFRVGHEWRRDVPVERDH